jgi:hypothetical protein
MRRELSSAYHSVENRAHALMRAVHYYTKDTLVNTLVVQAAIKIIVLLGAILVSCATILRGCFKIPYS